MQNERTPVVSVIMGVYNQYSEVQLLAAVNSILIQTFKDFEFIIYDDGSEAEPAALLQNLMTIDSRIRVIRCEENHGLAFSLNRCSNEAKGKYLARMDADDFSLPNRLEEEVKFLDEHPEYDWVGCNAKIFEGKRIRGTRIMAEEPNKYNFLPFSPYIHPTVMFRRSLFETGSSYNVSQETLRCEDYELFMRLYQQGYRGYNLQKILFLYREDVDAYRRRTCKSRLREVSIRRKHFCKMGLPWKKRVLYTFRPIMSMLIPYPLIAYYKKMRMKELSYGKNNEEEANVSRYVKAYIQSL